MQITVAGVGYCGIFSLLHSSADAVCCRFTAAVCCIHIKNSKTKHKNPGVRYYRCGRLNIYACRGGAGLVLNYDRALLRDTNRTKQSVKYSVFTVYVPGGHCFATCVWAFGSFPRGNT